MHCDRCWLDCCVANGELTFKAYILQSFHTYSEFKLQRAEWLLYITQSDFERRRELCLMNCSKSRLPRNTTAVRREQSELRQFHNTRCCDGSNACGRSRRVFRNWPTLTKNEERSSRHVLYMPSPKNSKCLLGDLVTVIKGLSCKVSVVRTSPVGFLMTFTGCQLLWGLILRI